MFCICFILRLRESFNSRFQEGFTIHIKKTRTLGIRLLTTSAIARRYLGPVPRRRRSAGSFPEQRLVIEPRYAFVCIAPHLPPFQVRPSKSRLFRSQSTDSGRKQKNTQNPNRVWPGRNPVSYRKPRFCKRRVWMQVKVKFPRIEAICFSVCVLSKFVFSQALLYFIFNWSSGEERCVTTLKQTK